MAYTTASLYHSGGRPSWRGAADPADEEEPTGRTSRAGCWKAERARGGIRLEGVAGGGGGSFPRRRAVAHRERDARLGIGQRREDQSAVGAILPRIAVDPLVFHLGSALDGDNVAVLHARRRRSTRRARGGRPPPARRGGPPTQTSGAQRCTGPRRARRSIDARIGRAREPRSRPGRSSRARTCRVRCARVSHPDARRAVVQSLNARRAKSRQ